MGPGRRALVAAATLAVTLGAVGPASAAPRFGLQVDSVRDPEATLQATRMAELHAQVARVAVDWGRIQRTAGGPYDWSAYDDLLLALEAQGVRPLLLFDDAPPWARDRADLCLDGNACPPARNRLGDFQRFVRDVVSRYTTVKPVHPFGVEIWNEENIPTNWNTAGGPDPARYAELLHAGAAGARAGSPGIVVCLGGLAGSASDPRRNRIALETMLQAMYDRGLATDFDAIGVHAYPHPPAGQPVAETTGAVEAVLARLRDVRDVNGDGATPIWVTETGIDDPNEVGPGESQASLLLAIYDRLALAPDVQLVSIFRLRDDASSGYGLLEPSFGPRQSFAGMADGMLRRLATVPDTGRPSTSRHRRARGARKARLRRHR